MHEQTICAALFAGGASRRMGTDKALLPWRGSTLVRYLAGELDFFSEKLLSAQQPSLLPGADWRLVPDLRPGCGPLGALESVLSAMRSDAALCVACDLPFFTRELGQAMLRAFREGADCLVCRDETGRVHPVLVCRDETGRVHPVCAIYHRRIFPVVSERLQAGDFRMMHLLANLKTDYFPVTAAQMQNANTPEIWSEIQKNEHA